MPRDAAYNFRKTYPRKNCAAIFAAMFCRDARSPRGGKGRRDGFLLKMHDTWEERRRGEDRGGLTRHSFIIAAFNIARERGGAV